MGLSKKEAKNSIRISLSKFNTLEEMKQLVKTIFNIYEIELPSQVIIKKKL